ncbi:MAG: hypothetical protein GWM92_09285 [Gemmatimonadetes bacterium]|nr:hypothetical protein [Gemmatimonadota bacterium]NIR78849.1 hypothetical protein [Gemmatimonadota bacterium]NIT87487.1 hypothetical protein [Gemmatimonadota bacterium]NIU31350.1 hypothetical protein [Gemmatimonadota bacterium]NIU36034.1 hypothetical protein [Gemmatimonadota bacterium]
MRSGARKLGAVLLAAAAALALAGLSRMPYRASGDDQALLRLSWRIRAEQTGAECRRPSEEELEALPLHMRNPDGCVGSLRPFRLRVRVDGRTVVDDRVRPAGARGDRPVYVFRDVAVSAGERRVHLTFDQEDGPGGETAGEPVEADEPPMGLELRRTIHLAPREVALVTLDDGRGELVVRGAGGDP